MRRVSSSPLVPGKPLRFAMLRVPFFLEPDYPRDESFEESNLDRLRRKWGGAREFEEQKRRHRLKERGLEVGIQHFKLDRTASSTFASHRLVQWVTRTRGASAAERLYSELNRRHFELGQKLNDAAMLAEAAEASGAVGSAAEAEAFLASGEGGETIERTLDLLRNLGVHSIPTTVVEGEAVVSGAARADELEAVFRRVEESGEVKGRFRFAESLGIPPERLAEGMELH
mmetsp:Transcript_507/g.1660  ORF Transcript_507/g.1660 Transcript_507/m.1660 type:complete len:229 (-) Transcript_507:230-916(-)